MTIEDKINKYANYLAEVSARMTFGQKAAAKKMLEEILTDLAILQRKNEKLSLQLAGMPNEDYPDLLHKMVDLIKLAGFDLIDVSEMDRKTIEFMLNNQELIMKNGDLTATRIQNIANLVRYHYQTKGEHPKNMSELVTDFNEIKDARNKPN